CGCRNRKQQSTQNGEKTGHGCSPCDGNSRNRKTVYPWAPRSTFHEFYRWNGSQANLDEPLEPTFMLLSSPLRAFLCLMGPLRIHSSLTISSQDLKSSLLPKKHAGS